MLLETLSNLAGPSGFEGEVRNFIKEQIMEFVDEVKIDRMGNIIAHKRGQGKKVVVAAHMDEVGLVITGYNEDGTLTFQSLGGINAKILPSKPVLIGEKRLVGVIGLKPIHLQSEEEKRNFSYKTCCIDIGAIGKEEAKKSVALGEYAVFDTVFETFGEGFVKGKALDDRVGCSILIELLKENYTCDLYGVFNVQEETGSRGAYVSAYNIEPELGVILEGTICADMPNIPKYLTATELRKGPAISMMDSGSIFDYEVVSSLRKLAEKNKIPYQLRKAVAGGNDASSIQGSGEGARVVTISVPCRYLHSSVSVCSIQDYENTKKLAISYLKTIG
ncbi:MAG: M42 family metallopeptidase [Clostridiaceae bacterium]|nr:M42 family metallopeptidase [Clostridiaceae bacterium]